MRFSLFSVMDYYEDGSRTLSMLYEQLLDQIVEADRLGFEAFWIGEHHGYLTPHLALACPNPAILLTAAAQRTRRIGLNTAIANLVVAASITSRRGLRAGRSAQSRAPGAGHRTRQLSTRVCCLWAESRREQELFRRKLGNYQASLEWRTCDISRALLPG